MLLSVVSRESHGIRESDVVVARIWPTIGSMSDNSRSMRPVPRLAVTERPQDGLFVSISALSWRPAIVGKPRSSSSPRSASRDEADARSFRRPPSARLVRAHSARSRRRRTGQWTSATIEPRRGEESHVPVTSVLPKRGRCLPQRGHGISRQRDIPIRSEQRSPFVSSEIDRCSRRGTTSAANVSACSSVRIRRSAVDAA